LPRNLPQPKRKIFNLTPFLRGFYDFYHLNRAKRGISSFKERTLRLQKHYINTKLKRNPDKYQGLVKIFLKEPNLNGRV